jgi:plastocyanin
MNPGTRRLGNRRRTLLLWGAGLAALTLGAAACGGSTSHAGGSNGGSSTSSASGGGSPSSASGGTSPGSATVVTVGETEFKLSLSTGSFSPGRYVFKGVNNGRIAHSLEITGPGVDHAVTRPLQPGQSADLDVTLRAGSYDLFCPIDSHKSLGMNAEITVGTAGAAASTASAASMPTSSGAAATTVSPSGGGGAGH